MHDIPSGLALTALANYLIAEVVDARRLAIFGIGVELPWGVKFMYGPLVDRFQNSAMGQRRPWVLGARVMAIIASQVLPIWGAIRRTIDCGLRLIDKRPGTIK